MRTIKLNKMYIANFKGIQAIEIALNGQNKPIMTRKRICIGKYTNARFVSNFGKRTAHTAGYAI